MNKIEEQEFIAAIRKKYEIDETHKKLDDMEITITQTQQRIHNIKFKMDKIKRKIEKMNKIYHTY